MKNFAAVRTEYYKYDKAVALLDHVGIRRNGFTRSANVVRPDLSHHNVQHIYQGAETALDALNVVIERHTKLKKKRPRSDFNMLFEHVIILSEEHFSSLENKHGQNNVAKGILNKLRKYAEKIQDEFGFEPLGISLHLDEGKYEYKFSPNGVKKKFIRNTHAHIDFYNYDFKKNVSPLRHLMVKGLDENNKTNELNPNFVRMQDISGEILSGAGFRRGVSKLVTGRKHLRKELFVLQKLAENTEAIKLSEQQLADLQLSSKRLDRDIQQKINQVEELAEVMNDYKSKINDLSKVVEQLTKRAYSLTKNQLKKMASFFNPNNSRQRPPSP
ncbi:hypothetical protein [Arsukibacterium perlucidum]|uniref:hypothetical protein n=1 Tax=Arsukibacterium perlucidum TaxID=368811 RepID=UPI00035F04EA|nr:hypothetical protein [Arsukibacterium perlucidum]